MGTRIYKCDTCKDDPRGVLGFNSYGPCPDCNDLPMSGPQKDRAAYDLARILDRPFVKPRNPDDEQKRKRL